MRHANPGTNLLDELAGHLGHERHLLELLLFKLVEGKHLLAAGEARFLPYATTELVRAGERVLEAVLRRGMLVSQVARGLDTPEDRLTLNILARQSVEPYRMIFADHHRAFIDLAAEVTEVTRQSRDLAADRAHHVEERLVVVDADISGALMEHLTRSGYQAFLGATAGLSMPSLVDFLR